MKKMFLGGIMITNLYTFLITKKLYKYELCTNS
jgi:uncharacterized membrane protein